GRAEHLILDQIAAGAIVVALSPFLAFRGGFAVGQKGRLFDRCDRLGRGGHPIVIRSFSGHGFGQQLPHLLSVIAGDVRVIGPMPADPADSKSQAHGHPVRPGLLSAHRLRARTGIAYEEEPECIQQSLITRESASLILKYAATTAIAGAEKPAPDQLCLEGVSIANLTLSEALTWVVREAQAGATSTMYFVNADSLNQAAVNPDYWDALRRAGRVAADGIGVKLAARFHGWGVRQNVNGTDLFPLLCDAASRNRLPIYLLGSRPGVAAATAAQMTSRFPGLQIAGCRDGFFATAEEGAVIEEINRSGARVLLVGMGVPAQELWLDRCRAQLDVGVALGVGGLFDFSSGRIPRAPQWVRELGLEWGWRLAREPRRMWRRYVLGNPRFLVRSWLSARHHRRGAPEAPPALIANTPGALHVPPGDGATRQPIRQPVLVP
ncbi:MAG TPA: WecB/TagA/CpsF family glycosyltransferase, partial [Gemmatimonadota bacterium]|nr:WecB/TagA/CpsF family glycosyltransferase [Gemmatimonadota bacterium]